jgi:hypothetical protein
MTKIPKRLIVAAFGALFCTLALAAPQNQSPAPTPPKPPPSNSILAGRNPRSCPPKAQPLLLSPKDTGEVVEGPACVGVIVNALRYSVEFGRTVTFTAGPNLAAGFAPPATPPGGAVPQSVTIDNIVKALADNRDGFRQFDRLNANATAAVTQAITDLKALVSASDDVFRTSGARPTLATTRDAAIQAEIRNATNAQWRAADQIYQNVKSIQDQVATLLLGTPNDADKARLSALQTDISSFITELNPSTLAGDKTAGFYKQKAIVEFWSRLFASLNEDSFVITTYVSCGVSFNQNRQVAIKLIQYDRLPLFDGQPIVSSDVKDPFVTVNCSSPFSVSAGVELRFLANQTFGLVPSGSTGSNVFGVTQDAKTAPLPIGMVHVRLAEWENHRFGLHASSGVGAHLQGSASGGSAAEFLFGFSLSLFRTVFITPGWHYGQVAALGGGYKIGDPVPSGVTTVPVSTSYKSGFGLAFTFTKP